ncbi:hypothetical protein DVH24_020019 [Malus domestica]|uniref:Uncharacterized protein n=1 Tax=Malus domestica TaxID=3750 RepID=A0A498J731_MALDO|nr:hypothetical protein DVH24_020019 [Malus domestica]
MEPMLGWYSAENLNGLQTSSPLSFSLAKAASKALYSNPLFNALKFGVSWGGYELWSINRPNGEPHGKIGTSRSRVVVVMAEVVEVTEVAVVAMLGCDFEELVDYKEKKEKASDSAAKVNGSPQKPKLLRSIVDSGFEHPSEDERRMKIVEMGGAQELMNTLGAIKDDYTRKEALKALTILSPSKIRRKDETQTHTDQNAKNLGHQRDEPNHMKDLSIDAGVGVADGMAERERANLSSASSFG